MDLAGDERAQSIQIGAVLLFGVLIIAFSSYQAFVVPDQNRGVEFNHNQEIQGDLLDVRNGIITASSSGTTSSATLQLGTQYPSRLVALNPGPPSGQLRTVGTTDPDVNISVRNATVPNPSDNPDVEDFWNGTTRDYSTGNLVYTPNYNLYRSPPTTGYENTLLYNDFPSGTLVPTDQRLIEDDQLYLVTLNGSVSTSSSASYSVDIRPRRAATRTVSITNTAPNSNVTVMVPTRLSQSTWESKLEDERVPPTGTGHVYDIDVQDRPGSSFDTLLLELEPGEYQLQIARAGVGTQVVEPGPAYITDVAGGGSITEGESDRLTVEVRDRFNNPVAGVRVNASTSSSDSVATLDRTTATTDSEGQATFTYQSQSDSVESTTADAVNASFTLPQSDLDQPGFDPRATENLTVDYQISPQSGGTGGGQSYEVEWTDAASVPGPTASAESCPSLPCDVTLRVGTSPSQNGALVELTSLDTRQVTLSNQLQLTEGGTVETQAQFLQQQGNTTLVVQSGTSNDLRTVSTPAYADFEGGLEEYGTFGTFLGGDADKRTTQNANSGSTAALLDGGNDGGIVTTGYDTTGGELVVVQYWVKESDTGDIGDGNGGLSVEYLDDTGTWQEADQLALTGTNPGQIRTVRLGSDAIHDNFSLRFRQTGADAANDEWLIDDPQITVIGTAVGPGSGAGGGGGGGGGGNSAPTAQFSVPSSATVGESISFDASGSTDPDGDSLSYSWDFGDGSGTATGVNPSYSYGSAGTYTVELTVSDGNGGSDTATQDVTVSSPSSAQALETTRPNQITGGARLEFYVRNTGSTQVTVENFSVNVDLGGGPTRINEGTNPELSINNGFANRNGNGANGRFEADGTTYDLVADSDSGQYADIGAGSERQVRFRGFDRNLGTLEYANSAGNADITVTLGLSDGSQRTIYFAQV